ncbi:aminotransferase class IV [Kitasatospora sp. NPDC056446]|uniref:aminotransferase class IV n=1 Tax=Kitasatospora sp. NPDC056446 TaxID=3345819 RepID=UPI0036A4EFD9
MTASSTVWFNGALAERRSADPSVASNTLHLGIAVFDGLMAYRNGGSWYLHRGIEHVRRFTTGAARMDLALPWSADELLDGIWELLETVPPRTHYVRPIAYRTGPEVFFQVERDTSSACVFAVPVERDQDEPLACRISGIQRVPHRAVPASWKVSGAYANSYLAAREARASGYDDGIMLDAGGLIAEASTSNLFFVRDGALVTPRLTPDIFPGITRAVVVELAGALGVPVLEEDLRPAELPAFEAAFLCGTLSELRPIDRIGDLAYRSEGHPVFRAVLRAFRELTHQ